MSERDAPGSRAQISSLAFAVLLLDPDSTIVEANPAAEDLLGRSVTRLVGASLFDALFFKDPAVGERMCKAESPLVARGVAMNISDCERHVNVTVSPFASHPGWRVLTLSNAGQGELSDATADPGPLGAPAILAHEIKNPLAAIRGASQLIARKLEPADRPLAELIGTEAVRIASLLDRMQRIGAGIAEPNAPINLHAAVRRAVATVRGSGIADADVAESFDPSLPTVLANQDALEQVVINLLANARDACAGQAGAQIVVRTRYASGLKVAAGTPGSAVALPIELTVSDNGPGIDPSLGDRIFEPFVSSKKGGEGLGLALVRRLVGDMGGRIAQERDARAGMTHFRVHLPVAS